MGCQGPVITEYYDEFQKAKVCKLDPYLIRNEYAFTTSRQTLISFETQANGNIKGILTSQISGSFFRYTPFDSQSKIKFILTTANQRTEELTFQSYDLSTTYNHIVTQTQYARVSTPLNTTLITFDLTADQLRKIGTSSKTEFYFESGENPVKGELSDSNKAAFQQFLDKCIK
jgi:hypothetical protein